MFFVKDRARQYGQIKIVSNTKCRLTQLDKSCTPIETLTYRGNLFMKKINKINPIAKELPKFGKRVVPDKRKKKLEKQLKKEIRDGKTSEDS